MSAEVTKSRVYVTGGADEHSFSGCSYYFTADLKANLSNRQIVSIPTSMYKTMRLNVLMWAIRFAIDPRPYFFMTSEYQQSNLRALGRKISEDDTYISFSPILPKDVMNSDCNVLLMVDMTLDQYLKYDHFHSVPKRVIKAIKRSEQLSYVRANRIFAATEVTLNQLTSLYDVSPDVVEVVGRGVNLPLVLPSRPGRKNSSAELLNIGFVGHDFKRKGLLTLIKAIESVPELINKVIVHAVGPTDNDLSARPWLRLYGYISKKDALGRYIEILENSDLGYLFSQSEGIPGSVLEFLALGVPCLISDIHEMESIRDLPGVVPIALSAGVHGISQTISDFLKYPDTLIDLRKKAAQNNFQGWDQQAKNVASWCKTGSATLTR